MLKPVFSRGGGGGGHLALGGGGAFSIRGKRVEQVSSSRLFGHILKNHNIEDN